MAFVLKPYAELAAMSQEELTEALLPIRSKAAKAKADGELAKLEERKLNLERDINVACAKADLDFQRITDLLDEYALTERNHTQITDLIKALFPVA